MNDAQAKDLHTKIAAGRILTVGAARLSSSLDIFSSWLLAGFGAMFGLLIANFSAVSAHINANNIKVGAGLFLVAAGVATLQKLLAAYVAATSAASEDGRALGLDLANSGVPVDVLAMYGEVRKGLYWPISAFNERMTAKARSGDYAVTGRQLAFFSQLQIALVVFQVAISLGAAVCVVRGITI